jgi:hypothetical protein
MRKSYFVGDEMWDQNKIILDLNCILPIFCRCPGVQEETQDNTAARFKINVPHRFASAFHITWSVRPFENIVASATGQKFL